MEEKKEQGLTEEWKREVQEMVERHYGVKLGPDTPEDEARLNRVLRLWKEQQEKARQSTGTEQEPTLTE